jgi:hypothetical protein
MKSDLTTEVIGFLRASCEAIIQGNANANQILRSLYSGIHATRGYHPRPVQLIAVLLGTIVDNGDKTARILQMETGEGKSLVFAMIAAYHALTNRQVKITTSSMQLAKESLQEFQGFFQLFNISHAVFDENEEHSKTNDSAIVYGTMQVFAGQFLRKIKDGKPPSNFDVLLLDEVDAALVDGSSTKTMLSMDVAGLDKLSLLHGLICQRVQRAAEVSGDMNAMPDPEDADFLKAIGLLESDKESEASKIVPEVFAPMTRKKLKVYMENAWYANALMKKDREYCTVENEIVVIDHLTSGEVLASTNFGQGLHQFLQIKEQLPVTAESLNSLFISNGSFVRKFKTVFGVSGTIGDLKEQRLVRKTLGNETITSFVVLPRFRYRPFTQLPPLVLNSQVAWECRVVNEVEKYAIEARRVVLVIFQDVHTANQMITRLNQISGVKIFNNITNNENKDFDVSTILQAGNVVISTNFGGRGTDYKLSKEVLENGGLHTILSFFPNNLRVADQAFGRSARTGQFGSGTLICFDNTLSSTDLYCRVYELSEKQNALNQLTVTEKMKKSIVLNEALDSLFTLYCEFCKQFEIESPLLRRHFQLSMHDRFGFLIEELSCEETILQSENIGEVCQTRYTQWESELRTLLAQSPDGIDAIFNNARRLVMYGVDVLKFQKTGAKHIDAISILKRAIEKDRKLAGSVAQLNLLKAIFAQKKVNVRNEKDYNEVKAILNEASKLLNEEIEEYAAIKITLVKNPSEKTRLSFQLDEMINILSVMKSCVDEGSMKIDEAYKKRDEADRDKFSMKLTFARIPDMNPAVSDIYDRKFERNGFPGLVQFEEEKEWVWSWYCRLSVGMHSDACSWERYRLSQVLCS